MTRNEIHTAAWMAALNQIDGRSFPEMRGAFPALRSKIEQILRGATKAGLSGLSDLGAGIFDAISGAITAAADIYSQVSSQRADAKLQNLALQSQQAQINAAQQIAAMNAQAAATQSSDTIKTIAMSVGGLGIAGLIAWMIYKATK